MEKVMKKEIFSILTGYAGSLFNQVRARYVYTDTVRTSMHCV